MSEEENEQLAEFNDSLFIHPALCNACNGYYSLPNCIVTCPVSDAYTKDFKEIVEAAIASVNYWKTWLISSHSKPNSVKDYVKKIKFFFFNGKKP